MVVSEILELGELFLKAKDVFNQLQIRMDIGNCQNIFRDTALLAAYTVDSVDVIYTVYTIQTALHCLLLGKVRTLLEWPCAK